MVVGGGPAGLSAAIQLKKLATAQNREFSVCVVEKGSEIGAHLISGAVMDPRALYELIPDWQEKNAPIHTPVHEDHFYYFTEKKSWRLPTPPQMKNDGNYIISLSNFCRWLGEQAQALGVEIYPGFAADQILYDENGGVAGIQTKDMGVGKDGAHLPTYEPGVPIYAKMVLLAEGCRGSLSQQVMDKFNLRAKASPQTYGLGVKEVWEIDPAHHKPGTVIHSVGWPLDHKTYGGSFLYHFGENLVSVGFVVGLDYQNPTLSPFQELQRFKTHPAMRPLFEKGKRISYGARALNEGGYQSIPHLSFPGGALIGDAAGFLNVPKIKGIHTAMKSGMVAARTVFETLNSGQGGLTPKSYQPYLEESWLWKELKKVRNIRPGFRFGLIPGLIHAALDTYVFRGFSPWTLKNHADHTQTKPLSKVKKIDYPKPDGVVSFDLLSSVYLSNTNHVEYQPSHLVLKNPNAAIETNFKIFGSPEQYYCPAGVYEIVDGAQGPQLKINAQNCVHCKTCDIKDPTQNITWTVPEGGGGPNYSNM